MPRRSPPLATALLSLLAMTANAQAPHDRTFVAAPGSPVLAGPLAGRPVLADMDGDGHLDVVLACGTCCGTPARPDSGRVLVLRNDGTGRLTPVDRGVVVGPSVRKVAVGDLDGDGRPDVVAAEHDRYEVTVLRNTGGGRLAAFAGSPIAAASGGRPHTHDIALADLDGDGLLDVLTTNANDHTVSVLRGRGKGMFAVAAGSPFGTPWRHPYDALAVGDFDRDGVLDVAVPLLRDGRIAVLTGDGTGALKGSREATTTVSARPGYVIAVDVNGDGALDLVSSHDDTGVIDVLLNDGKGRFAPAPGSPHDFGRPLWGLAAGDLDGDGNVDLAIGHQNKGPVLLARGDGKGGFTAFCDLTVGDRANYVAIGDLDGDGRNDVVVSCYGSGEVFVYLAR
jgi:hypothetical protein